MPRQQRPPRDRRNVTPNAPAYVPTMIPNLFSAGSNRTDWEGLIAGSAAALVVTGIPAVIRVADGAMPTAAFLNGAPPMLALIWGGAPVDSEETFIWPERDPSVRTSTGGFMAPGEYGFARLTPGPNVYTAAATGAAEITLSFAGSLLLTVYSPLQFGSEPNSRVVSACNITGSSTAVLTMSGNVSAGDVITYAGIPATTKDAIGLTVTETPVTLT